MFIYGQDPEFSHSEFTPKNKDERQKGEIGFHHKNKSSNKDRKNVYTVNIQMELAFREIGCD